MYKYNQFSLLYLVAIYLYGISAVSSLVTIVQPSISLEQDDRAELIRNTSFIQNLAMCLN